MADSKEINDCNVNHQKKRSFAEMNATNEPLPSKRQKLNKNTDSDKITKEDMDFLFQLKQQSQTRNNNAKYNNNPISSLHKSGNGTTHPNQITHFKTPSIASTNNSTTMDALSTTATIHTNPPNNMSTSVNATDEKEQKKDKCAETYYRQIVHRSSRIGGRYQASILPIANSKNNDSDKYGGSQSKVDSPTSVADTLREERNNKRNELDTTGNGNVNGIDFNDINFEEESDSDDEDFNMDEMEGSTSDGKPKRVMEGIMGRRSDWLKGDSGTPVGADTRLQYLVKWKDAKEPIWEFADELEEAYQQKIDLFEDDEMEDMLDESKGMTVAVDGKVNEEEKKEDIVDDANKNDGSDL